MFVSEKGLDRYFCHFIILRLYFIYWIMQYTDHHQYYYYIFRTNIDSQTLTFRKLMVIMPKIIIKWLLHTKTLRIGIHMALAHYIGR